MERFLAFSDSIHSEVASVNDPAQWVEALPVWVQISQALAPAVIGLLGAVATLFWGRRHIAFASTQLKGIKELADREVDVVKQSTKSEIAAKDALIESQREQLAMADRLSPKHIYENIQAYKQSYELVLERMSEDLELAQAESKLKDNEITRKKEELEKARRVIDSLGEVAGEFQDAASVSEAFIAASGYALKGGGPIFLEGGGVLRPPPISAKDWEAEHGDGWYPPPEGGEPSPAP